MNIHCDIQSAEARRIDERAARRLDVEIAAGLRSPAGRRAPVVVRNISIHGFMAEGGDALLPAMPITLELFDGQSLAARVVWKRDCHFGAAFDAALDGETFAEMIRREVV
jgi:hypothetical protein